MKRMRVMLEVDVDDLSARERTECARGMECSESEIPTLADTDITDAAHVFRNIGAETSKELFAGSEVYVQFKDVRVTSAEWID